MKNLPLVRRLAFQILSASHNFKPILISMSDTEDKIQDKSFLVLLENTQALLPLYFHFTHT